MSGKGDKKLRRVVNKKVNRDNQAIFQGFMLEISAQPFWQRFWFCFWMAFKRHALQKSIKEQIAEQRRFVKAQKVAMGEDNNIVAQIVSGFLIGIVILAVGWMAIQAGG